MFTPKTNVYWLNYTANRMAIMTQVKHVTMKQIKSSLKSFLKVFPSYDSATTAFLDLFVTDNPVADHRTRQGHKH